MAVTIDATAGGASANSYITLADAETYFESRYGSDNWDSQTDAVKNALLVNATRLLDQSFDWQGDVASSTQALRWPRDDAYDADGDEIDSDIVPDPIKNATCEMALYVVTNSGSTVDNSIKSAKVGSIEVEYRDNVSPEKLVDSEVVRAVEGLGDLKIGSGNIKLMRY